MNKLKKLALYVKVAISLCSLIIIHMSMNQYVSLVVMITLKEADRLGSWCFLPGGDRMDFRVPIDGSCYQRCSLDTEACYQVSTFIC